MNYIRNSEAVLTQLITTEYGQVLTKVPCRIQVPVRYFERGLGQTGLDTFIYGFFPIILETGEYTVLNAAAMVEIDPFKITVIKIEGVEYLEFHFLQNQVVIKTTDVIKRDTLMYNVFDEFIFKGKAPWFASYEDIGKLFDTAKSHADSNIGANLEVIEFIASIVARKNGERTTYLRDNAETFDAYKDAKMEVVPMMSVFYAVKGTANKLTGAYFADGVVSAIVNPTDSVQKVESILRA